MTISPRTRWRTRGVASLTGLALLGGALSVAVAAPTPAPAAKPDKNMPNTLQLAGPLADQKLKWEGCEFSHGIDQDVRVQLESWANLECTDVRVPQDWKNPSNGKTFTLRVSRVTNLSQSSPNYKGTIVVNPGGPGGDGLHWAPNILRRAPELAKNYNTIGIDPRGVGQSEQPYCVTTIADDMTPAERAKAIGETCSKIEEITKITTEQTAYDFDFVRGLLEVPKITYIGYSYGTWLGTWYGNLFGPNIDRMILDSSLDTTMDTLEGGWDLQPIARDRQFNDSLIPYTTRGVLTMQRIPGHERVYDFYPTTDAEMKQAYWEGFKLAEAEMGEYTYYLWTFTGGLAGFPDPQYYPLARGVVETFVNMATMDYFTRNELPPWYHGPYPPELEQIAAAPSTSGALIEKVKAAQGPRAKAKVLLNSTRAQLPDTTVALLEKKANELPVTADTKLAGTQAEGEREPGYLKNVYDPFDAIRCGDGQWTQGQKYWDNWMAKMKKDTPFTGMLALELYPACAFWPTDNPTMPKAKARTFPDTLVIQAEEDSQTGWEGGYTTGTKLPNTRFIAIDNATKHGYFPYRTSCVDTPAFAFLLTGAQPKKQVTVCQGKALPDEEETFEMWSPLNHAAKHVPGKAKVKNGKTGAKADWSTSQEEANRTLERLLPRG